MKVKDVIAKQEEYRQIQQARNELELWRRNIVALYDKTEVLGDCNATSTLIEIDIMDAIIACRDKLKKQLNEMEV